MKKYIKSIILIGFIILCLIIKINHVQAVVCNHTISSGTLYFNGRNVTVNPGQTICLTAGSRNRLILSNLNGTIVNPITIINSGGLVDFNQTPDGTAAIEINNSHYFRLTGTGDSSKTYGIKISKTTNYGVALITSTDNYVVDHLEIGNVTGSGFSARTFETCPNGYGAFGWDDFDYNGDGTITSADRITRGPIDNPKTLYNHEYRNNYLHDLDDAFYIGSPFYFSGASQSDGVVCGSDTKVYPLPFANVKIHDNVIERTQSKALMVKSGINGCQVDNNYIYRDSLRGGRSGEAGFCAGIQISEFNNCEVHHNIIKESNCMAILLDDKTDSSGSKVYDNLIIRPGNWNGAIPNTKDPSYGIYSLGKNNSILNNTIIDPKDEALYLPYPQAYIQNNLIYKPVGNALNIGSGIISNNIISISYTYKSKPLFIDPSNDNYSLSPDSPAINAGTTSLPFIIMSDLAGNARLQGEAYDIGAYEYGSSGGVTPTDCPLKSLGDFNCDGKINESDLNALLNSWLTGGKDLTGDGKVNESDLNKLLGNWKTL